MKKVIVTTTIQPPTQATLKFCRKKDWIFIIVGDLRTPHQLYVRLMQKYHQVHYLSPDYQEKKYKQVSDAIGWNNIQRRNIGFIEAYHFGADVVATVDDDNLPYDNWGKNLMINREIEADLYEPRDEIFDPLSITKSNYLWHRGYPIDLLSSRLQVKYLGKIKRKVLVQADLWDGDPDIDAIARLTLRPIVKYPEIVRPYCSNKISPFNSQNTFLARKVLRYYAVLPHVGRMDDIWGGYILQHYFPDSLIYNKASVYQDRNKQDLITNLEKEIMGYRVTHTLIKNLANYKQYLPSNTINFLKEYKKCFHN